STLAPCSVTNVAVSAPDRWHLPILPTLPTPEWLAAGGYPVPPHFAGAHAMSVTRLTDIELDSELQPRAEIDAGVLLEYGQRIADGVRFPPVVVFRDAKMENNWLTDGFHRWYAHKAVGLDTIEVRIIEGSRRDALLYSLSANSKHGLQRGVLDYRRAYEIAV